MSLDGIRYSIKVFLEDHIAKFIAAFLGVCIGLFIVAGTQFLFRETYTIREVTVDDGMYSVVYTQKTLGRQWTRTDKLRTIDGTISYIKDLDMDFYEENIGFFENTLLGGKSENNN